jgi:isopentenyl-diphosphate delta-isomerase
MSAILSDEDEVMDLVDQNDEVVGSITHDKIYDRQNVGQNFIRAANVFLINDKGQLWIPKRTAHKKIAPNGLDYSAGEHVQAGETYRAAAVRGLQEELNLDVAANDLTFIAKRVPADDGSIYFTELYTLSYNDVPDYNPEDFVSYEWLAPAELLTILARGVPSKPSLATAVELYLAHHTKQ